MSKEHSQCCELPHSISLPRNRLAQFNQQVLECQDHAFTLAWYLLGDEAAAEAVTEAAVKTVFHPRSANQTDCRVLVLCQVIHGCCGKSFTQTLPPKDSYLLALHSLSERERQVLVLVDILNTRYLDVAAIMNRPVKEVIRLVAQARRNMMRAMGSRQ